MKKIIAGPQYFCIKNGTYYYRRAIPARYRELAGCLEFKDSLATKDYNTALEAYVKAHAHYDTLMNKLKSGIDIKSSPLETHDIQNYAKINNISPISIEQLIDDPYELKNRLNIFETNKIKTSSKFNALFDYKKDEILLSELIENFIKYEKHKLSDLDDRGFQKLINPKKLAIRKLIEFIGTDIQLVKLTRKMAKDYYDDLKTKIANKTIQENTAGKYLTHVRVLIKKYYEANDIEAKTAFDGLNFSAPMNAREAFSVNYLKSKWIGNPIFDKLNLDARTLLFAMLDTGAIASELVGLIPNQEIILNADIPHIKIQHNQNRRLKTSHRGRVIPLIGQALKAFQDNPNGFTRYSGSNGAENASGAILKFLTENNLKETERHVIYSLRHTFKDRLRNHDVPQELQNYLMGHKDRSMGAHYGSGYKLEKSYEFMKIIESDFF